MQSKISTWSAAIAVASLAVASMANAQAFPSLALTKDCVSEEIFPGDTASFRIRVTNTGNVPLTVDVIDEPAGIDMPDLQLGTGTCVYDEFPDDGCLEIPAAVTAGSSDVENTVDATGTFEGSVVTKQATATCPVTVPAEPAACSPGYLKKHPETWCGPEAGCSTGGVITECDGFLAMLSWKGSKAGDVKKQAAAILNEICFGTAEASPCED